MRRIVQKFGGSSVRDAEHIQNVAAIIADTYRKGYQVVVVLSAQGDTTDELIKKAEEIHQGASRREMDMLLSVGEQISIALCAMALEKMHLPVISLTGWQVGIHTTSGHGDARIQKIDSDRISGELDKNKIVIVAGFQGVNRYGDVTTLGRGGSDTSAVALAAVLHADLCQIYTDVDGIYTADPRKIPGAQKLTEITYDEMLELACQGAQILHNRSVEMARKYHVRLEVLSSLEKKTGTRVRETVKMERTKITGVVKNVGIAHVVVTCPEHSTGTAFRIISQLSRAGVHVDTILQSVGQNRCKEIHFTVTDNSTDYCKNLLNERKAEMGFDHFEVERGIAKISVVGAGVWGDYGEAARVFEALYDANIHIQMISSSKIRVSVFVNEKDADPAVEAIHRAFFGGEGFPG